MSLKKAEYKIEVDGHVCYLSEMGRGLLSRVLSMIQPKGTAEPDYVGAGEKILQSCWLKKALVHLKDEKGEYTGKTEEVESDSEILDDHKLLEGAALQAYELIDIKEATLTKL